MIRYQRVNINLPESDTTRSLKITEVGRRLGHVPGWAGLYMPEYDQQNLARIRNIALPRDTVPLSLAGDGGGPGYSSIQEELYITEDDDKNGAYRGGHASVNPDSFTLFAVVRDIPGPEEEWFRRQIIGSDFTLFDDNDVDVALNFYAFTSSDGTSRGFTLARLGDVRQTGLDPRVTWESQEAGITEPGIVMVTFSVQKGLSIWWNGKERARNDEDRRPLTVGYGPGELQHLYRYRGSIAMRGHLDIDLSAPENAGYRRAIEAFASQKYGFALE